MQLLQDFIGLFKRNQVINNYEVNDKDVLPVGRYLSPYDPISPESKLITAKDFALYAASNGAQGPPGANGPQGPQGIQGIQGNAGPIGPAGLTWQGAWDVTVPYSANDAVSWGGASYFAINAVGPSVIDPSVDPLWALLASQGAQGPQGPTGGGFVVQDASRVDTGLSVSQFLFRSLLIPGGSFTTGDIFHIETMFIKTPGNAFIYKCYINTANTLTGADLLWQTDFQSSRRYMNTIYTLMIDRAGPGDTTTGGSSNNNAVTSGFSQYGNAASNHAIDWSVDQYILIGGVNSDSATPVTNTGAKIF